MNSMFETAKPNCMATAMVVALAAPLSLFAGEPSADNWRLNSYHPLFTAAERTRPHVQTRSFSLADWPFLDGQWEGILCDSDGDVWFSIASHSPHHHAQLFRYDRRQDRIEHVADVGEACGETDSGNPPQDKIHTQMWEDGDVIYCGTCEGHATDTSGYRGGYWLKIDKPTRTVKAMAKSISGEGLYVMAGYGHLAVRSGNGPHPRPRLEESSTTRSGFRTLRRRTVFGEPRSADDRVGRSRSVFLCDSRGG